MAWIRQESNSDTPTQRFTPDPPVDVVRERKNAVTQPAAHIGKTVVIQGEVRSDEDLVIDGRIEGTLNVKKHRLTLGASGKIHGEVHARWVVVSGEVEGDVQAGDRLEITQGGVIRGDVRAPRLIIAEGARLQGAVDTDPVQAGRPAENEKTSGADPRPSPQPGKEKTAGSGQSSTPPAGKISGNGQHPAMHTGAQGSRK